MTPGDNGGWAAAIGVLAVLAVRLIDYFLPTHHHFPHLPWVDEEHNEEDEDAY